MNVKDIARANRNLPPSMVPASMVISKKFGMPVGWVSAFKERAAKLTNKQLTRELIQVEDRLKTMSMSPRLRNQFEGMAKIFRMELNERGLVPGHGAHTDSFEGTGK